MTPQHRLRRSRLETLERRDLLAAIVWDSGPDLPAPRTEAVAVVAPNSVVHLLGGDSSLPTTTPVLSPTAASWTTGKDIDFFRNDLGAVRVGSTIYLVGGTNGNEGSDEVLGYVYSITGDSEDAAPMNDVRYDHGYASDSSGRVYAIGGIGVLKDDEIWSSVERYSPSSDSWAPVASLPIALRGMSAIGDDNGHLFVFGGTSTLDDSGIQNSTLQYDVATDAWSNISPMPVPTRDSAVVMDEDGLIYVVGGMSASGPTDTVQVYDPQFNSWALQTPLPQPVYSHAAVYDSLGRIMVVGGFDSTGSAIAAVYRTQRLNVPQTPPVFSSNPDTSASLDTFYQYDVNATGNPEPTYSLASGPAGMTIEPASGLISWQPVAGQEGTQSVTVRASNFEGQADQSFDITVSADTIAPTTPADFTFDSATETSVTLSWTPSSDAGGIDRYEVFSARYTGPRFGKRWVYTLEDTVVGTTSTITGLTPYTSSRYTVQAVDTAGNRSARAALLTATTVSVPTISFQYGTQSSGVLISPALHPFELSLNSRANPTAAFSLVSGPATMNVDATSGLVQWTPSVADIGSQTFTFRATNSVGSADLVLDVDVVSDSPKLSVAFNPTSGGGSFAVAGTLFAAQINDASLTPSTFELVSSPVGMTIDPASGLISWTPSGDQGGAQDVTVRATNAGGTASLSFPVLTLFTAAVSNVGVTGTTLLEPTASWSTPTGEGSELVDSYQVAGRATWGVGRTRQTHRVNYTVPASETSVLLTGLVTGRQYSLTITPIDAAGNLGLANTGTTFVSSPALPQVRWSVNGFSGGSSVPGTVVAGYSTQIVLTDQRPDPSTIELVSGPTGLIYDAATRTATWTPGADDVTSGYNSTEVAFRATNEVGSVDVVVPVRVFFSGAVSGASTTKFGNGATASWNPPTDNATPISGYRITRHWTWSGRRRSVTWTVGNTNSISFSVYPTGAVSHKGITVTPIDANGNFGVSSGFLRYDAPPNTLPPVAVDDTYDATEDVPLTIDVANGLRSNDIDTDNTPFINPLVTRLILAPANGTATLEPSGAFTYSPNPGFNGVDTFLYAVNDGAFFSNAATVTINVAAVNDAPIAKFDYYAAEQETLLSVDSLSGVLGNDVDVDADALTAAISSGPTNGSLTLAQDGSFQYTPNLGFIGVDSFQYLANDGTADSNVATAYVAVDAPFALNDSYSISAGVPLVVDLADSGVLYLENFDVPDAPSALDGAGWSIVTGTDNPTIQSSNFAVEDNLNVNKITAFDESVFGFTSGHVFLEHDIDELILGGQGFGETFIYTEEMVAANGGNPLDLNGTTLFVDYANGNGFNGGPSFQFAVRSGDNWFAVEHVHNVSGAVQTVTKASTGPLSASLMFVPITVSPSSVGADARILYHEATSRSLTTEELADITAAGILAHPHSDGMPARFDNFAISTLATPPAENSGVLDNDRDPNPDAAPLTAQLVDAPANGTIVFNLDGSFVYTPSTDFRGTDSFTYRADNGSISSNIAMAMIEVVGEVVVPPPSVESIEINDGEDQRSVITSLTVTFDTLVDVAPSAFTLTNVSMSAATPLTSFVVDTEDLNGQTIATLSFGSGSSVTDRPSGNSLANGSYELSIDATQIIAKDGQTMAADYTYGAGAADNFFRSYGDVNGNGIVDLLDFAQFRSTFGKTFADAGYVDGLDSDGDLQVGLLDFAAFRKGFGT